MHRNTTNPAGAGSWGALQYEHSVINTIPHRRVRKHNNSACIRSCAPVSTVLITRSTNYENENGKRSPGTNMRSTPASSITTNRITPPDEPSRAMAWDTAAKNTKYARLSTWQSHSRARHSAEHDKNYNQGSGITQEEPKQTEEISDRNAKGIGSFNKTSINQSMHCASTHPS
jgi:hypothetical protein